MSNPSRSFDLLSLPGILILVSVFITGCMASGQGEPSSGKRVSGLDTTPSAKQSPNPPDRAHDSKLRRNGSRKDKEWKDRHPLPAPKDSCDDLLVLVDKKNHLPRSYVPKDLVALRLYGVPVSEPGLFLRREAATHLRALISAARADGQRLVVASAFRSYAEQRRKFAEFVSVYGKKKASVVSARPGQSQHQLGTAVDFTNAESDYKLLPEFGKTSESRWLKKHAPEYGFVLSYSNSAEPETGVQWEPWHYRYIGEKNARRLEKSGLSVQSFLEREGVRPRC